VEKQKIVAQIPKVRHFARPLFSRANTLAQQLRIREIMSGVSKKRGRTQDEVGGDPQSKRILTATEGHNRNVAAIIIGVCNPEYYQLGLRFRDPYNSEDTAIYYVWDKLSSSKLWPQEQVTGLPLVDGTANTVIPNDHGPYNQFTSFLFHGLMRRYIHDFKNKDKIYTSYRCFGQDGYVDFLVDNVTSLTEWTDLKIGGAVYDAGCMSGAIGAGGASNPWATMALTTGSINIEPVHDKIMAPGEFRGDNFMYSDGCSLAHLDKTATTAKVVINNQAAGTGDAANTYIKDGIGGGGDHLNINEFKWNATGSVNLAHGQVPLSAGTVFCVQVIGYNEGQPYELQHASYQGLIPATPVKDQVFFSYPLALPDYYRVRFSCSLTQSDGTNADAQPNGASVRLWFINTGEMWAHKATPDAEDNFKSVRAHRGFGTTLLATNDTPVQTKGGRAVTAQLPLGQDWMTVQDGKDPFQYVARQLREKDKNFTHGHYSWLRLADVKETMVMRQEVIPAVLSTRDQVPVGGTSAVQQAQTFSYPLFKVPVLAQVCTAPEGTANKQTVLWTIAANGEYSTGNQWQQDGMSIYSAEDWEVANAVMSTMDQGMENETHAAQIAATAGKVGKGSAPAGFESQVMPWVNALVPLLEAEAAKKAPMMLPLMMA
jgi:hypothetical protein